MDTFKTPCRSSHRVIKLQVSGERPQPWTASRCHRLLRPLLSRIALLKKEVALISAQPPNARDSQEASHGKRQAEDDIWLVPRKKLRHTYSQRYAERSTTEPLNSEGARFKAAKCFQYTGQDSSATQELTPFTPLLRRARGHDVQSPAQEPQATREQKLARPKKSSKGAVYVDIDERLASLRAQASPARCADYEAIFRALEALLKVTKDEDDEKRGTSSLLNMCLRKVPGYISGVQAWEVYEAEKNGTRSSFESSNTSFRIYSDLEEFGASSHGWRHLSTVTRSDALSAIRDAMAEDLFSDEFSILLIDLCVEYGAANEADSLVGQLVARQYPEPSCAESTFTEDVSLRSLSFLRDFCTRTRRFSFLLRTYSNLLFDGLLPLNWVVTREFQQVWALAYRIISRGVKTLEAINYLVTAITLICRQERFDRTTELRSLGEDMALLSQQALSTALAVLSAMRITGENEIQAGASSHTDLARVARIRRNLMYTLDACLVEVEPWKGRQRRLGGDLLCLAMFLSTPTPSSEHISTHLSKTIEWTCDSQSRKRCPNETRSRRRYDVMVSLISSIAKICGHGTSQAARDHLERLCKQLGHLGLQSDTVKSINKAGAFFLAQQTNDLRDLIYAEKLASSTASFERNAQPALHVEMLFVGYRWEETIGEWITVSPMVEKKTTKRRFLRSSTTDMASRVVDESETCAEQSPTRTSNLISLVAELSAGQRRDTSANIETSDKSGCALTTGQFGFVEHPHQNNCETRNMELRTALDVNRSRNVSSNKLGCHDELGESKENRYQEGPNPPQRSNSGRRPLETVNRRRMRVSIGNPHSDDELGI